MKVKNNWKLEKDKVKQLSIEGKTLKEIGNIYGVSREQIRQVLERYFPELSAELRGASLRKTKNKIKKQEDIKKRTGRDTWKHESDLSQAMSQCFTRKKQNAKYSKWGWEIQKEDITFPLVCPILGIELDWFAEYRTDASPSFDRIDPNKGYIPGNVIICSWRANRIKNDGLAEEHRKIATFMETHLS